MNLAAYPKIWNVGHPTITDMLTGDRPLVIQEKVDGSQFSFSRVLGDGWRV